MAAMPSSRPVNPSRSDVVALTDIRSMSISSIAAKAARMVVAWGPILGRSQINVTSQLASAKPRERAKPIAWRKKI